jgi:Two component regulator propeller
MKIKLALLFIVFSLSQVTYCNSQGVPIGQWKDYLSYYSGLTVCQGGGNIYCCCSSGVFAYNLNDNSLQRYNKVTGLSDIGCTVARYNPSDNTLVIGYSNGNIDIMSNNQVINIPDLKNSSALGSKTINNIFFSHDSAFVSCGQGILVIDLTQDVILDEYIIGPDETTLNVYSTTIYNDSVFAATAQGIYKISEFDPNPDDYTHWTRISKPLPPGVYNGIVTCGTKMYASFSDRLTLSGGAYLKDTIYVCKSGKWSLFFSGDNVNSLECSTVDNIPYLLYTGAGDASAFDSSGNLFNKIFNYGLPGSTNPYDALLDNNLNFWMADNVYGLVETPSSYSIAQTYVPPGPFSNSVFALAAQGSTLYVAPGGYDQSYTPDYSTNIGVSEYSDGSWNRLIDVPPPNDTVTDLCCLAIDPKNPLHLFAGSWGCGVLEFNNNSFIERYNSYNSTILNGYLNNYYPWRIGGVGFDTNSNLWAANSSVYTNYLSVKHTNGTWQSFDFSGIVPTAIIASTLLVTHTGAKWLIFPNVGILAYQDNGTFAAPNSSNSVLITNAIGNGNLPSLTTYCMAEDQNGAIWIGNNTQVVVFYSPDNIYNGPGGWDAQNVYVQQTGYTQYLMQNQFTTCIAVDGANRKWFGTTGGGAFLMSADGTQQILNLTSANSPLLSNNILSIAINQLTGEVFFGTDQGIVSFQGTSTEGKAAFSNVYTYPDPVPHGYSGPIAIKNLVTNSDVKIATVSGEIVYHTIALGGQAIWYGTNFNGERVQTGVYLVFCTSPDGTQSLVTKLLLIN